MMPSAATRMQLETITLSEVSQKDKHHMMLIMWNLKYGKGLPWWRSRRDPPANAGGDRLDPWSRKIPHAVEQLKPRSHNY